MALRQRYGKSSSSKRGVYISSGDNDSGPQIHSFTSRQLQNDTGTVLRAAMKRKREAINLDQQEQLNKLYEYMGSDALVDDADDFANEVMEGNVELPVSHAGGELLTILLDDSEEAGRRTRYKDPRTRRDRLQNMIDGFVQQEDEMTRAFMEWEEVESFKLDNDRAPLKGQAGDPDGGSFLVVDIMSTYTLKVDCHDVNIGIPSILIHRGMIPSSPYTPHHAFSIRLLEFFHNTHLRCPHLSIDAYVKGLCDSHGIPYRQAISKQFTIAYDVYLQIRNNIQFRINVALKRDNPRWRLQNCCPACTHKLKGEQSLPFSMLITMDGNDSLKRVLRKVPSEEYETQEGPAPLVSREVLDNRQPPGDYYISLQDVDRFAKEHANEVLPIEKDSPCAPRWNNMNKEKISRMWGVFDESGFFLSLCRHGYTLVATDMVQSGEQSKYALAIMEVLLDTFGSRLGVGYDIGCRFAKTIAMSSLGPRAQELEFKSLIGSFHGHAHNRACQLDYLATYVEGMGLEDLEGCERFFSKSNALASSVRYASKFHRQQKIVQFMKHMDKRETAQQLSAFLVNNYKQALNIIKGEEDLRRLMDIHDVENYTIFHTWLEEERTYLANLTREPPEETLEIEYYLKLKALDEATKKLASNNFISYDPNGSTRDTSGLRHYHQQERVNNLITVVQGLENIIKPECRWREGSEAWKRAEELANRRDYQRALDNLERLVVQRMFELSSMNMAQSGYQMRKHVAKALQVRSEAIRTALTKYNAAAIKLRPPQEKLEWDQVVEYSFLSDFDLLRDTRQDIRKKAWANPVGRSMRDKYFKILRAREEISRLNIEIRRVITHIYDESRFLEAYKNEIAKTDPHLAYQVHRYWRERVQYNELHLQRFEKLRKLPGFTGVLEPGTSLDRTLHDGVVNMSPVAVEDIVVRDVTGSSDSEDEESVSDSEDQALAKKFDALMTVAY